MGHEFVINCLTPQVRKNEMDYIFSIALLIHTRIYFSHLSSNACINWWKWVLLRAPKLDIVCNVLVCFKVSWFWKGFKMTSEFIRREIMAVNVLPSEVFQM